MGGNQWKGEDKRRWCREVNMVEVFYTHVIVGYKAAFLASTH
jgi:hypothetical protein